MEKQQKIALVRSIIKLWGGFNVGEVQNSIGICVGELGGLVSLIEYLSLDCIDVSVYEPDSFSSDSIHDYTMEYSELDDEVLNEIVLLCKNYNKQMLEQEEE
jgi:hypothetical protein